MAEKAKSNSIVTYTWDESTGIMTFNVLGVGTVMFDTGKVSRPNRKRAEWNGWGQRIVDAAAISRTTKDGKIIPDSTRSKMKFEAMKRLVEHYESGSEEWSLVGKGGVGFVGSLTLRAFAAVASCTIEDAKTRIEAQAAKRGQSYESLLAAYRSKPGRVREEYERLRDAMDEEAGDTTTGDDLLDEAVAM